MDDLEALSTPKFHKYLKSSKSGQVEDSPTPKYLPTPKYHKNLMSSASGLVKPLPSPKYHKNLTSRRLAYS